jgi:hypothetical protein
MPIGRYIAWVGASLLVLMFVANWFFPQSLAEPTAGEPNRPTIRISSMQQPPERVVIDTNLPAIVPPPNLAADAVPDEPPAQVQTYASVISPSPIIRVEKTEPKAKKKQVNQLVSRQPLVPRAPLVASSSPATITPPPTRLSFANIISGQLVRELFNLH